MNALRIGPRLAVAIAVGALGLSSGTAHASGFQVIENSARGLANSFAGMAAVAEDASTVWFNPAGMMHFEGNSIVGSVSGINPHSDWNDGGSVNVIGGALGGNDGGDGGTLAVVPAFFTVFGLSESLKLGFGVNVPFGLETEWKDDWQGRYSAIDSSVLTNNYNLALGYRVDEQFSVGVGVNYQYIDAELSNAIDFGAVAFDQLGAPAATALGFAPEGNDGHVKVEGDDWSFGWNAGVLFELDEKTRIGLSYRSSIKHTLKGTADFTIPTLVAGTLQAASGRFFDSGLEADIEVPSEFHLSAAHELDDQITLLADITWVEWSTVDELVFEFANPAEPNSVTPFDWDDTWRASVGAIYKLNDKVTLRGGLAFDESPIQDKHRTHRLPGEDRIWVSFGVGYQLDEHIAVDLAYAHLFIEDADIDQMEEIFGNRLVGDNEVSADILSLQITLDF